MGYFDLLSVFALPFLILTAALLLLGLLCPDRIVDGYASALFGFAILLWVQGSFLMGNYGVFDGRGLNWEHSRLPGWADASIWIFVLAAAVRFSAHIAGRVPFMSGLLLLLQLSLMLVLGGTSREEVWVKKAIPEGRVPAKLLRYSSSQNIIHIVLDSFQTDVFQELIVEEGWESDLEGFVLFRENVGAAPYTSFSLPAIFSGRIYDGTESPSDYYQDSIQNGFQNRLYDAGYTVNLMPHLPMQSSAHTNYYRIPSVYGSSREELVYASAARLLDVALFRQSPHWIRIGIYNDNNWFIPSRVDRPAKVSSFQRKAFFLDYIRNIEASDSGPAYHFIHLMPPHPPYVTRRDGSYAGEVLANTRENYKNEARAILELFLDLVDRLKELRLYDSSLILLQGDHGSQIYPVVDGKVIHTCQPRMAALLTVKLPGTSGPFKVSSAPTSLLDIPSTIMNAVQVENDLPGRSVFEIDSAELRKRPFLLYHGQGDAPEITKYSIVGSIFDSPACVEEGRFVALGIRPQYEYGTQIRFGLMGNADGFVGSGWSLPKNKARWNNGKRAGLVFRVDPPQSDLVLKINFSPYLRAGKVPKQTIHVMANGHRIDTWTVTRGGVHRLQVVIPNSLIDSPELAIDFDFPDAVSPKAIGTGGDARRLAIEIHSAVVDTLSADY